MEHSPKSVLCLDQGQLGCISISKQYCSASTERTGMECTYCTPIIQEWLIVVLGHVIMDIGWEAAC